MLNLRSGATKPIRPGRSQRNGGPPREVPGVAPPVLECPEGWSEWPSISVVIPCRNEAGYIGPCLDSVLAAAYPPDRLEIIVADGRSEDGTREILAQYAAADARLVLLDNPERITPVALNRAIRAASGDLIVRVDAHAVYPPEYIPRLVAALLQTGADNVGGRVETVPADSSVTARAIAIGLSHRLGVGNSHFRIGTSKRRWVDHVPFGCWRRTTFERIGLFDEQLPRDQDVEFNARLITQGGRVLLLPEVVTRYYGRRTLRQLGRMLYQYGYFKPLVARKVGRVMTVRQLIPPLFVLALIGTAALAPWWSAALLGFAAVAGAYAAVVLGCGAGAVRRHGPRCGLVLLAVLPLMHLGYGLGYLQGLCDHFVRVRRSRAPAAAVALTR